MNSLLLTKEVFRLIYDECIAFEKTTGHDVDVQDVLYSFLHSTPDTFCILNDWDEGKYNDPFWNEDKNEHSAISFLKDMCDKIRQKQG